MILNPLHIFRRSKDSFTLGIVIYKAKHNEYNNGLYYGREPGYQRKWLISVRNKDIIDLSVLQLDTSMNWDEIVYLNKMNILHITSDWYPQYNCLLDTNI